MKFFDYVFYKCCQYYERNGEKDNAPLSGLIALSVLQSLNILSIIGLIAQYFNLWLSISKFWYTIPFSLLLILNGIRFNKLDYTLLKEKWNDESLLIKNRNENKVLMYMVGSIILIIVIIVWRRI